MGSHANPFEGIYANMNVEEAILYYNFNTMPLDQFSTFLRGELRLHTRLEGIYNAGFEMRHINEDSDDLTIGVEHAKRTILVCVVIFNRMYDNETSQEHFLEFFSLHPQLISFMGESFSAIAAPPAPPRRRAPREVVPVSEIRRKKTTDLEQWVVDEKNFLIRLFFKASTLEEIRGVITRIGEDLFFRLIDEEIYDVLVVREYPFSWRSLYGASTRECNAPIAAKLLQRGVLSQEKPENWVYTESPSFAGMSSGNEEVLGLYLLHGADVNEKNSYGASVLDATLYMGTGDESYIRKLINCGVDVTSTDEDGNSVLYHAVDSGIELDIIEMLVEAGADVNCVNMEGEHILDLPFEDNEVRTYLIEQGAKKQ